MPIAGMVLCAGLGLRLRPLTDRLPKPALPVLDAPLLRRHLALLRGAGISRGAVNTHHLPTAMRACAEREAAAAGLGLRVSHESTILGTAGGIREAMAADPAATIVVLNGDTLFDVDLAAAIAAHRATGAAATMVLAPLQPGGRYAAVEADAVMRVRRIAGVGPGGADLSPWHFTGVHVLGREFFRFVAPSGSADVNRDVYPRMIKDGLAVHGHVDRGWWSEAGTPARFLALHLDFVRGRVPGRIAPGIAPGVHPSASVEPGATVEAPCYMGAGARAARGARVGPDAFVGAGAEIGPGAEVRAATVLARTRVAAGERVVEAIAMDDLRVAAGGT